MEQLGIYDAQNYRTTDPETSRVAGEAITRSGRRTIDQEKLLYAIRVMPDLTAMELADWLIASGWKWFRAYQVCNKRISDLYASGRVRCTGQRECRITGTKARTWAVISASPTATI